MSKMSMSISTKNIHKQKNINSVGDGFFYSVSNSTYFSFSFLFFSSTYLHLKHLFNYSTKAFIFNLKLPIYNFIVVYILNK